MARFKKQRATENDHYQDENEDKRPRGAWWTYWDKEKKRFNGPEISGNVLAYSCWTPSWKGAKL